MTVNFHPTDLLISEWSFSFSHKLHFCWQ